MIELRGSPSDKSPAPLLFKNQRKGSPGYTEDWSATKLPKTVSVLVPGWNVIKPKELVNKKSVTSVKAVPLPLINGLDQITDVLDILIIASASIFPYPVYNLAKAITKNGTIWYLGLGLGTIIGPSPLVSESFICSSFKIVSNLRNANGLPESFNNLPLVPSKIGTLPFTALDGPATFPLANPSCNWTAPWISLVNTW